MADNDQLLKQIGELILASEERTKEELVATKRELIAAITASQEDTIEVLKEYIHTAYDMHNDRIEKIEDVLDLPHPDKN